MTTTINVNGTLVLDQSIDVQDNDLAIDSDLNGLSSDFRTFLLNLSGTLALSTGQRTFAAAVEAARTADNYITVTQNSAAITDLYFSDPSGNAFDGDQVFYNGSELKTINGDSIYFHSYAGGNIVLATTSGTEGAGEVVAAFYLNEAGTHLSAGIEMVTFIGIAHPDTANPDDRIDWSDLLNVSSSGSISFDFDVLQSGKFLWAAIGTVQQGLLISGYSLAVDSESKATNASDFVNTSQGGLGATIGIDNQMFTPGDTAVLTLVEGFDPLSNGLGQAASSYLVDTKKGNTTYQGINYTGYTDVNGAKLFFSQDQGSGTFTARISLWEAGGTDGTPEQELAYKGTGSSGAFDNDTQVPVETVTIYGASTSPGVLGPIIATWAKNPTAGQLAFGTLHAASGVRVSLAPNSNEFVMSGLDAFYTAAWTVASGDTFNRFRLGADFGKFDIGRLDLDQGLTITTPVGDTLFIDDDGPSLSPNLASVRVEEDELSSSAPAPADSSDGITDGDAFTDEASFTYASLLGILNPGTDVPASFALNLSVSGAVRNISGAAMTSKGDAITWGVVGGVVQAVAGGSVIFTITHDTKGTANDPTDDEFHVDLRDQIDHANASGDEGTETLDLTPAFRAFDADGDPADLNGPLNDQTPIRLVVENDVPALSGGTASVRVEEDELSVVAGDGDLSTGITDNDAFTDEADFTNAALQAVVTSGADEPVTFRLNLSVSGAVRDTSGTALTSKGDAITWNVVGGVVQAVAGGRVIFTLTQTAGAATPNDPTDDVFRVDLRDQVDHANASGDNGTLTVDLTPAFTARDRDGDAVDLNGPMDNQRPIQLVIENDVPAITSQILDGAVDFVDGDFVTKSLNGNVAADDNNATNQSAGGTRTYTITSYTDHADLTEVLSPDGTRVDYYSGTTLFYSLELGQSGAGTYTFTVHEPPPMSFTPFDFTDLPSGQNLHGTIAINKGNINNNGTPNDPSDDFLQEGGLLVVASNPDLDGNGVMTNVSGTVNTSKGGGPVTIGNKNQAFDSPDEGCWFIYVDNPKVTSVGGMGLTQTSADDADTIGFDGTIAVDIASVEIVQASGAGTAKRPGPDLQIKAYDINPQTVGDPLAAGVETASRAFLTNPDATGSQVSIVGLKIIDSTGKVIEYRTNDGTLLGALQDSDDTGTTVTLADDSHVVIEFIQDSPGVWSVNVRNLKANYTIEWETAVDHDAVRIQHLSGSYDIGGFNLFQGQDVPDREFDFSVKVTDYDGDVFGGPLVDVANFSVTVDGTGQFNDPLFG